MSWKPFPLAHLPECARQYADEVADTVGCDAAQVALPLLTCLGAAIGNSRSVILKKNHSEPALLWTLVAAEEGSQQSWAMELATVFMRQRQEKDHELCRRVLETEDIPELMGTRKGRRMMAEKRRRLAIRPRHLVVSEVNLDRLAAWLSVSPRGLLWLREDAGSWLGRFGDGRSVRESEIPLLASLHRAGSVTMESKRDGQQGLHIQRAYVAIAGSMEAEGLPRLLRPKSHSHGLLRRFLIAMPPRRIRGWTEKIVSTAGTGRMQMVFERLSSLVGTAAGSHLEPVALTLDDEARAIWLRFLCQHAERMNGGDGPITGAWSELECCCARLALIFKLVQWADTVGSEDVKCIDGVTMDHAARLTHWFAEEAERIYRHLQADPNSGDGDRELLEWISNEGGTTTVRKLMLRFRRRFPGASAAEDTLRQLCSVGFLIADLHLPLKGGHAVVSYRLNPERPFEREMKLPEQRRGNT